MQPVFCLRQKGDDSGVSPDSEDSKRGAVGQRATAQSRERPTLGWYVWYRPSVGVPEKLTPAVYLFNVFQFSSAKVAYRVLDALYGALSRAAPHAPRAARARGDTRQIWR